MDKKLLNTLLVQMQAGDESSFEKLYNLTNKSIFTFVYSFVKQRETAEDLMQETFIKIKRFIQSYKPNTNASAWMLQIAKNLAYDHIKKYKQEKNIDLSEIDPPANQTHSPDTSLFLHDLMNKHLSLEDKQIVLLHDVHGYKNREIAQFLNLPLGTVLWKYNKAVKLLRKKYEEESKWK